jgi:DNA-binding CsgD family transcriptional regulator
VRSCSRTTTSHSGPSTWQHRSWTVAAARIRDCCAGDLAGDFRGAVLAALRPAVPFDGYLWTATDPAYSVGVSSMVSIPGIRRCQLPELIGAKYLNPVNRWTALGTDQCVSLVDSTNAPLSHGSLCRPAETQLPVADIASMVFRDRFGCWGFLDLWRCDGSPFTQQECAFLGTLARWLTRAHRLQVAAGFRHDDAPAPKGPAVVLLDDALQPLGHTAIAGPAPRPGCAGPGHPPVMSAALEVAAQLMARENGIDGSLPRSRTALEGVGWAVLHAGRVGSIAQAGLGTSPIAVCAEVAGAADRVDVFSRAYGLTRRETDVLVQMSTGEPTRQIAQAMGMSVNTVQQHLKAIFGKTGTSSRAELVAQSCGSAVLAPTAGTAKRARPTRVSADGSRHAPQFTGRCGAPSPAFDTAAMF